MPKPPNPFLLLFTIPCMAVIWIIELIAKISIYICILLVSLVIFILQHAERNSYRNAKYSTKILMILRSFMVFNLRIVKILYQTTHNLRSIKRKFFEMTMDIINYLRG